MNTSDEMALRLHQTSRRHPAIETLMDEFFGRIVTAAQYAEQLRCVEQEFPCVITNSPSSLPSSAHF